MADQALSELLSARRPPMAFPLVRHLSFRLTPALARLPLTPNQITAAALISGLGCAWMMAMQARGWGLPLAGAVMLVIAYVLDNCDGEIAVLKNQRTRFGGHFDSFSDWVVNTAFFAALGIGAARAMGNDVWLWLGWIAAAGSTVNYLLGFCFDAGKRDTDLPANSDQERPENMKEWLVFAFRELFRADFCFIVLLLAIFDITWLLLPAGAIGAQAYWILRLTKSARKFQA